MSVGRVGYGALACAPVWFFVLACGERAGDPIVTLAQDHVDAGGASGSHELPSGGFDGRGGSTAPVERGPTGLCGPCSSSAECGDANDACISHNHQRFCGRDCDDQHGCPDGYMCVELANTQLFQCVPQTDCPQPPVAPVLSDVRDFLLMRINAERVQRGRQALTSSGCLDELAQDSALDFARSDEALGKYVKECDPIWPNCACGWNAEAELTVAHYGLDWTSAVDRALGSYRDSQNDRFIQAFLDYNVTDVGVGFWISGDEAWFALSFH